MDSEYDHFSLNSYLNHDSGGNAYLPLYKQTIPFFCSDVEDLDFLGFFLVRCIRGLVKPWLCVTTERGCTSNMYETSRRRAGEAPPRRCGLLIG
jgi:hypothetical protein